MNLVERVKNILLQPQQEWQVIEGEPSTPAQLYPSYIIPLAAIGPIAFIIGFVLLFSGYGILGFVMGRLIAAAIVMFVLSLAGVYVMALVIDGLAPNFAAQKNFNQAFKLATYSSTPVWLGGIFNLIPSIAVLGSLIGLYGLYLLYLGLPVLMKAPSDKAGPYTGVVVVILIIINIIIYAVTRAVVGGGYSWGAY